MTRKLLLTACATVSLAFGLAAPTRMKAQGRAGHHAQADPRYSHALDELDAGHWEKAAAEFKAVAAGGGQHADAALYWEAYAESKLGRQANALATLEQLERSYPESRWLDDAHALELEARAETGQGVSPEEESNLELKLLALNALVLNSPDQAVPLVVKLVEGQTPVRAKRQALFVLAQSRSPQALAALVSVAQKDANPELRRRAVEYTAFFGGTEGQRTLEQFYRATSDLATKRAILRCYMITGQRELLLQAAKNETAPELAQQAIQDLGVLGAQVDLWQLYRADLPVEARQQIVHAFFLSGDQQKLYELAENEKAPRLRHQAIRDLGLLGEGRHGARLAALYRGTQDRDGSRAIIEAFFRSGNAEALIGLARRETDPELKRQIVQKLSLMNSKAAQDYLKELGNK